MKRPSLSALAGGAAGAPAAAVLATHGAAGTIIIAWTGLATLIGALVPEFFWLLALVLAVRQRRWELRNLADATPVLRERILARDPVADIVTARTNRADGMLPGRRSGNRRSDISGNKKRRQR
ncbi:hypothetical protein ACFY1L_46190 [Streptomyces sp. NPDC001663]|uniref:hypothetical protein n=1 Tax=unclassified Streptomyces TaxID=2593676 RepID=UPI003332EF3A